jgi:hypothetical protein
MPSTYIGLDAILKHVQAGLHEGVSKSAKSLSRKSKGEAPVDEGVLAGGIRSTGARRIRQTHVEATVKTGPAADEYAIIQHERREGVEYMEGPLLEHAHEHVATVAAAVRRRL